MTDGLMSWQPRNTASNAQPRATRSTSCYPNLTTRPQSPYLPRITLLTDPTNLHVVGIEWQLKPNTRLHHPTVKVGRQQLQDTPTTYNRTWIIEPVRPEQSMDQGGVPQREKTTIRPGATSTTSPGPKIAYGLQSNYAVTLADTEASHTPYASPMR